MVSSISQVRVLDLSRTFAWSSWLGQILMNLGAQVIKVDRPVTLKHSVSGLSVEDFVALKEKKVGPMSYAVGIDIDKQIGREIIKKLIKKATVVILDFSYDELRKYELEYEQLKKINPQLVCCYIDSDQSQETEFATQGQGTTITMGVASEVLSALVQTKQFEIGCLLDFRGLNNKQLSESQVRVEDSQAKEVVHPHWAPYQTFATADGFIFIAITQDEQFKKLCRVLDCETVAYDQRFASNADRLLYRSLLVHLLGERFLLRNSAAWLELLEQASVPCSAIGLPVEQEWENQTYPRQMDLFVAEQAKQKDLFDCPATSVQTGSVLQELLGLDLYKLLKLQKAAVV